MSVSSSPMKAFTFSAILLFAACATSNGDAKIEATLRTALDDPTSTSRSLPFETERRADGTVFVPLFVRSSDPAATSAAIDRAGGTTSTTVGNILTARLPMQQIKNLAKRGEVISIEPSFKTR